MENKGFTAAEIDNLKTRTDSSCPVEKSEIYGFPAVIDRRYSYLEALGQGGSGQVYLAYDTKLQRKVALKFLNVAGPDNTPVLLQEARAQAQVKQQNICQIYEVSESHDQIYLIMQYIQGEPLNKISHQLNLEKKLLIISKLLRGLQQAHHQGIIHRDINPSNILLETSPQGELKPYLIDFGLAHRNLPQDQLTQAAGQGTPSYMAPEQFTLSANEIDRRADIYAVGATLYHLLTGQPPHRHDAGQTPSSQSFLSNIFAKDATSLKKFAHNIPVDLQSLVLKCLRVNPRDRYSSAKALADDIERYLSGDPIKAHHGLSYNFRKIVRKHKFLVGLVVLFLITTTVGASRFVYQSHQQQIREQLIQSFSSKVENMEARVRFTYMAPRHDISAEIERWNKEIEEAERDILLLGELVYGPGHYAIGRMHYALQEYDKAITHLQLAWNSGFQKPRVAYILALTNGAIYQRQKQIVNNLPNKLAREEKLALLDKKYRLPAIGFLERGMQASPNQTLARAMLYYYQGDLDKSLATLQQSTDFPSWFYQHKVLAGDIYQAQAEIAGAAHLDEEIKKYTAISLENYQQAIAIAPSDFQLQLKPINIHIIRLKNFLYGKMGDFDSEYIKAQQIIVQAKDTHLQNYQSNFYAGQLLLFRSYYENQYSGTPLETIEKAIEELKLVKEKSFQKTDIWLALAYANKFALLQDRGFDLKNTFINAKNSFEKVRYPDRDYFYYSEYGNLLRTQALNLANRAPLLSSEYFENAITAYDNASKLKPYKITAIINSGSIFRLWSNSISALRAKEKLLLAIEIYKKAIHLNPKHFVANYYLAMSFRRLAQVENVLFENNETALKQSNEFINIATAIDSHHPFLINQIAMLESDKAVYLWQKGEKYESSLNSAVNRINESLKKSPDNHILNSTLASIYLNSCQLDYFSGKLSDESIIKAYKAMEVSNKFSDYSKLDNLLLHMLENGGVSQAIIKNINGTDDRSLLLKAEWNSYNGNFELADLLFDQITQLYPSVLLRYRRQHILRWQQSDDENKNSLIVIKKLQELDSLFKKHYPTLSK